MIEEIAQVKGIRGDYAFVEVSRQSGCKGCNLSAGCGIGSIGRLLGGRQKPFSISNDLNLKVGDRVVLGLPENAYVWAGFLIYLLPLICLFVFSIAADLMFGSVDIISVTGAIVGLGFGIMLSARLARQAFFNSIQPKIIKQIW